MILEEYIWKFLYIERHTQGCMSATNIILPVGLTRKFNSEIIEDKFRTHYADGILKSISLDEIPDSPLNIFESSSKRFSQPNSYHERDFKEAFVVMHTNGNKTYVVRQTKIYNPKYATGKEKFFYLADEGIFGKAVTRAELRYFLTSENAYFKNKPFVEYLNYEDDSPFADIDDSDEPNDITKKMLKQQWIDVGTRQLKVMNALSLAFFSLPTYSNINIFDETMILWKELEKEGLAKSFIESKMNERYIFNYRPEIYGYDKN
jgi:hypothetical protein